MIRNDDQTVSTLELPDSSQKKEGKNSELEIADVTDDKTIDNITEVSKSATAKNTNISADPTNSNGSSFKKATPANTKKVKK